MKTLWTVFEKFKVPIDRSGEKKNDCMSSQKFFPTPKNVLMSEVDTQFQKTTNGSLLNYQLL